MPKEIVKTFGIAPPPSYSLGIGIIRLRDVNKDLTPKDQDKDKDLTPKDQDKDKDLTPKDQDKDKDLKYVLKESLRTRTRTRTIARQIILIAHNLLTYQTFNGERADR